MDFSLQLPRFRHLALAAEFLLYAVLTVIMLRATWLTWPDPYVDFSRELYLPWRVACGDVLYRDLAYYFGPLSVYANAALFAILGRPSIHALFAFNFAFWLATLLALRALLRRIARPAVAAIAVSLFILLFSFNRYFAVGNFNYLAPYSHELPRGFLLALLSLLSLDSAFRHRSPPLHFLSGFLLGLSLFTKPEIAVAIGAASATLFLAHFRREREDMAPGTKSPSFFPRNFSRFTLHFSLHAVGAFCAVGMVLLPLSLALGSFSQALRDGLLKLYLDCLNPALNSLPYFKRLMGTDDIPARSLALLFGIILAALPFLLARFVLPRVSSRTLRRASLVLLVLVSAAIGFLGAVPLNSVLILSPPAFLAILWNRARSACTENPDAPLPHSSLLAPHSPLVLAFSVFAFLLVSKMLLNAHVWHYGFVLALPAFCCAVLLAFRPPCPPVRAAVATALLLGFAAALLYLQAVVRRQWDISHPVHDSAVLAPSHDAQTFNVALGWIRANTPPGSTLAVLPEGAVLNVLSGRTNPTPYVSIPPTDWPRYDEASVLAAYSNAPPDTLVLVAKLGEPRFGVDYAQSLMSLLSPRYVPAFNITLPTTEGPVPYLVVATRLPPLSPP